MKASQVALPRVVACALLAVSCGTSVAQPISSALADVGGDAETRPDALEASLPLDAAPEAVPDADAADADRLTEGLVAWWHLDEPRADDAVIDSSERGNTGMPINSPPPSASAPPVHFADPYSRSFDGTSQYVQFANSDVLNFEGAITMAAWVYVREWTDGCQNIVVHGFRRAPDQEVFLRIGVPSCGADPRLNQRTWSVGSWDGTDHVAVAPTYDLDLNVWLHIAGVYDGERWHIYRNGEEMSIAATPFGATKVDADWWIGGRPPGSTAVDRRYFHGSIDEVRIYRRALSTDEIQELYHR